MPSLTQFATGIIEGIDLTSSIIKEKLHIEDKKRILKAILFNSLRSSEEDKRLNHYLSQCHEISRSFSNNYDLFASEFSFELEHDKLIKQLQDFSSELSSILSSIQGRILAIPLSLILAYGQMKTMPEDNPLFVNTAVLLAALVFSILMWFLLTSSRSSFVGTQTGTGQ